MRFECALNFALRECFFLNIFFIKAEFISAHIFKNFDVPVGEIVRFPPDAHRQIILLELMEPCGTFSQRIQLVHGIYVEDENTLCIQVVLYPREYLLPVIKPGKMIDGIIDAEDDVKPSGTANLVMSCLKNEALGRRFLAIESIPFERSSPETSKLSAKYCRTAPVPHANSRSVVALGFHLSMSDFKKAAFSFGAPITAS